VGLVDSASQRSTTRADAPPSRLAALIAPDRLPLLVVALAALSFMPSLFGDFIYDDRILILENPQVRDLSRWTDVFVTSFFDTGRGPVAGELVYYRPLVRLSYMIDWALTNGAPWVFHVVNLLIHALNAYLVVRLLRRWVGSPALVAAVALIFAIHPTRTESVAWIAGRTDPLMWLFGLLALEGIHSAMKRPTRQFAASGLALGSMALGILSKEPALLFPLLFAIEALCEPDTTARKPAWRLVGAGAAMSLLYLGLRALYLPVVQGAIAFSPLYGLTSTGAYLWRVLWPWPFSFFLYPLEGDALSGLAYPPSLLLAGAAAFVLFFVLLGVSDGRRDRAAKLMLVATAAFIAPVLNFMDSSLSITASDRFLYLPLLFLACAVARLFTDRSWAHVPSPRALVIGLTLCLAALTLNVMRSFDFRSPTTFWRHETRTYPENGRAQMWYAKSLAQAGQRDEALLAFRSAASPASARYGMLTPPVERLRAYVHMLQIDADRQPDGNLPGLSAILAEYLWLLGESGSRSETVGIAPMDLGIETGSKALDELRVSLGPTIRAEAAFVATRIGERGRARALLARLDDRAFMRVPVPEKVVMAYARLFDFEAAGARVATLRGAGRPSAANLDAMLASIARRVAESHPLTDPLRSMRLAAIQADLGAPLAGLLILRPHLDADALPPGFLQLYVRLLVAARLDQEALHELEAEMGDRRARSTLETLRGQLPASLLAAPAAPEPIVWPQN
jgi:hypothetical protein